MLRVFDIGSTLNAVMICRQIVYVVLSFSLMVYGGKSRTDYSVPSLGLFFRHDAVTGFPLTLTTLISFSKSTVFINSNKRHFC